jgi:hypothetical protein
MSYKVSLDLDGTNFEVLRCLCKCEQNFDKNGTPTSSVRGGQLSLLIAGNAEDTFSAWMSDSKQTRDGTINFTVQDSPYKKIEFKDAYIVKLHESFNDDGAFDFERLERATGSFPDTAEEFLYEQMLHYQRRMGISYLMQCTIAAEKITIDGVDHDNHW